MALRRESGAERAATVAGSKTMIDFIATLLWGCGSEWDIPRFADASRMKQRCCSDAPPSARHRETLE